MANQSSDRREMLAMLAKVSALAQFPGFSRWAFAGEHSHTESAPVRPETYQPLFFTDAEYKTLDQLTELIIPKDESPGARDAGVAEFIDFLVAHDDSLQYPFRTGLAWLDAFATEKHGRDFCSLDPAQQVALLRKLAYKAEQSPTEVQGQEFVALLRKYTVIGYYTSKVGLEELDYPGLKFYSASPACPHPGDPEHKHLPPPRF
jgi:gluconate 2-dehydrogenase gamma chain